MRKKSFTIIWNFPFSDFHSNDKKQFCKIVRHFVKNNSTSSSLPPVNSFSVTGQNDFCFSSEEKADLLNRYTRADFSDQFRKIIVRYKRIGYNINIMRQSACLVFNPITVNNFASLFNCTPVGRASDSMMAPT